MKALIKDYWLKHKDIKIAKIFLQDDAGGIASYDLNGCQPEYGPCLGNLTAENLNRWWKNRAISGNRKDLQLMLEEAGCASAGDFLAANLALSLTDTYWICPVGADICWTDINLFAHLHQNDIDLLSGGGYTSDSSLNGQMEKYWKRTGPEPIRNELVKISEIAEGQQNMNEVLAGVVHDAQGLLPDRDYVVYDLIMQDGTCTGSVCNAFTSEKAELVYAVEVLYSEKDRNDESMYEKFIRIAGQRGLDESAVRSRMEYMLAADFVLSNQDRHLNNFGLLRDTETMQFIGMAPLYDTGNAMFWDKSRLLSRYELLSEPVNSFTRRSAEQLRFIQNRDVLNMAALPDECDIAEFYMLHGMTENRAAKLAKNYAGKKSLYEEYRNGKNFSLYQERLLERSREGKNR